MYSVRARAEKVINDWRTHSLFRIVSARTLKFKCHAFVCIGLKQRECVCVSLLILFCLLRARYAHASSVFRCYCCRLHLFCFFNYYPYTMYYTWMSNRIIGSQSLPCALAQTVCILQLNYSVCCLSILLCPRYCENTSLEFGNANFFFWFYFVVLFCLSENQVSYKNKLIKWIMNM